MSGALTRAEAIAMLDKAIADDQPSELNRNLTRAQAVSILRKGLGPLDRPGDRRAEIISRNVRRVAADRCRHEREGTT